MSNVLTSITIATFVLVFISKHHVHVNSRLTVHLYICVRRTMHKIMQTQVKGFN